MDTGTSVFEYMYRDGGNFRTCGKLLLSGRGEAAEREVIDCLEWGRRFVAEQVGIPSLCHAHWASVGEGPSNLDHAFHGFIRLRAARAEDAGLPVWNSVETLLARMRSAAGQWDARLSPNGFLQVREG